MASNFRVETGQKRVSLLRTASWRVARVTTEIYLHAGFIYKRLKSKCFDYDEKVNFHRLFNAIFSRFLFSIQISISSEIIFKHYSKQHKTTNYTVPVTFTVCRNSVKLF